MPRFITKLLIRDGRVDDFAKRGVTMHWRALNDVEFATELRRKLGEEAQEAAQAKPGELSKELADVYEIVTALAAHEGLSMADVKALADAARARLGGFEGRVYSEWVEAPEGHEATVYHRRFPEKYPEIKAPTA